MTRRLKHREGPFAAVELERVGLLEDRRTGDRWVEPIRDHPEGDAMLDEHVEILRRWWGVYGRREDGRAVWLEDHVWLVRAAASAEARARGYRALLVRARGVPETDPAAIDRRLAGKYRRGDPRLHDATNLPMGTEFDYLPP